CPQVEAESIRDHPEIGALLQDRVQLRGLEHCLRRDAATDQAGPAQPVFLDDGGARPELGGSDSGHVTAWTAADDGDIKAPGHDSSFRGVFTKSMTRGFKAAADRHAVAQSIGRGQWNGCRKGGEPLIRRREARGWSLAAPRSR